MELVGLVLLIGIFLIGIGVVYIFLQYIDLLKTVKLNQEDIISRLKLMEQYISASGQEGQGENKEKQ